MCVKRLLLLWTKFPLIQPTFSIWKRDKDLNSLAHSTRNWTKVQFEKVAMVASNDVFCLKKPNCAKNGKVMKFFTTSSNFIITTTTVSRKVHYTCHLSCKMCFVSFEFRAILDKWCVISIMWALYAKKGHRHLLKK